MMLQSVLLPLFVQVLLTFVLLIWMAGLRVSSVRRGEVRARDVALREPNWTPRTIQIGNAFHNQLELPLLFYVLTILAIITRQADSLFVTMAWIFVALRVVHAFVHVTSNNLSLRGGLFIASVIVLAIMWGVFMLRIIASA